MKTKKVHCKHKFVPYRWDKTGTIVVQEKCEFCGKIR